MKRLLALVLALGVIIGLTACGSKPSAPEAPAKTEETPAEAQAWTPKQEIRIIVAYKAGGQSDLIARQIAQIIQDQKLLDCNLVVVNIPDGSTADGINALKEADPDGYTVMFHHNAFVTLHEIGQLESSYEDVSFVCEATEQPFLVVANADFAYDDVEDMIAYAKANPGSLNIGYSGFGSPGYFSMLEFLYSAGIQNDVNQITYSSGSEAVAGQLGGQIELRASNTGDSFQYIASGDIKPLIFMSEEPNPTYPDTKTAADLGFENPITLRSGFFAPAGTPDEVISAIAAAVEKACATEAFQTFCSEMGAEICYADGAAYQAKFDSDRLIIQDLVEAFSDQFAS